MAARTTHPDHLERDAVTRRLLQEAASQQGRERRRTLDQVVLVNRPVADSVARRFTGRGVDEDDLRQVAYEGLVKAVRRFDPTLGKDLLTFAVPTIRGELQRYFRDYGWMVRPTRAVQEAQWQVALAEDRLAQELGHHPSRSEMCADLGITEEEYAAAMSAEGCFRPTSLDRPVGSEHGEGAELGELLPDEVDEEPAVEARVLLAPAVRRLSRRAQQVIFLRFYRGLTQGEIGEEIGVTQTQVSRILTEVLETLRVDITAAPEQPLAA